MKKFIALFLVLLTAMLCVCGCSMGNESIRFGAAGLGGVYHQTATSIKQLAEKDGELNIDLKTTAGSAANVRLLSQGYLDAAIAQSDIISDAYNGENSFKTPYKDYSAVAALYTEVCHIVVRADSDINSIDDLLGKTVSIGEEESGSELNAKQILSAYGLNQKMIKEVNLDYAESAKELVSGDIDAAFWTLGTNATVIDELAKQCDIRLIGIDKATSSKLKSAYSYIDCTVNANTYSGQTKAVDTVGVKSVLIVSNKLSNDKVRSLTKLIFDNANELQLTVSADLDIVEKDAVIGVNIPFHSGAAEYYSEKGVEVKTAE